jgi:hypothetical protein
LDRIWRNLNYALHLLIGLGFIISTPAFHGWWSAAKGQVWPFPVVEGLPFSDARFRV